METTGRAWARRALKSWKFCLAGTTIDDPLEFCPDVVLLASGRTLDQVSFYDEKVRFG